MVKLTCQTSTSRGQDTRWNSNFGRRHSHSTSNSAIARTNKIEAAFRFYKEILMTVPLTLISRLMFEKIKIKQSPKIIMINEF